MEDERFNEYFSEVKQFRALVARMKKDTAAGKKFPLPSEPETKQWLQWTLEFTTRAQIWMRGHALARARARDWDALAHYFRRGGRLTPEIRLFLVDALSGKLRQPRVKKSKTRADNEAASIVRSILEDRIDNKKNAIDGKGKTGRQASRYLKKWRVGVLGQMMTDCITEFFEILKSANGPRPLARYYVVGTPPNSGSPNDIS
jgi:hypothetical protein